MPRFPKCPQIRKSSNFPKIWAAAPRRSRAGVCHALGLAPVAQLVRTANLIALARVVLGPCSTPYRASLFDKSPKSNWLVVLASGHRSSAPRTSRDSRLATLVGKPALNQGIASAHPPAATLSQVLALRVRLDHSTALNGRLRVLPATHTLGVLDDGHIPALATQTTPIECIVPAGGVLGMRLLLLHSPSKSEAETDRRVIRIELAAFAWIAAPRDLAVT